MACGLLQVLDTKELEKANALLSCLNPNELLSPRLQKVMKRIVHADPEAALQQLLNLKAVEEPAAVLCIW